MRETSKPTKNHKMYDLALNDHDMLPVVATGSAGTGKTHGATGAIVKWLEKNKGSKVIITRPNVSFGEDLGFLPGTVEEKLAPWVRPIKESLLNHGLSVQAQEQLEWKGRISYVPLEHIQGLNWDNTFIFLDEAQNMTFTQLRGFLTRTGKWSKSVIAGDIAQTSPKFKNSGLAELLKMIDHFDLNVHTINFTRDDILRGEQCKQWITAFEDWENVISLNKEIEEQPNVQQLNR